MNNWRNIFYALGDAIAGQYWDSARTYCLQLGDDFSTYIRADLCDSGGVKGKTHQSLDWIDDNWPTPNGNGEIDMAAILDAMWKSKGGQTMDFILYVDAMRGAISEKTVFAPYLASYLKHFQ